MDPDASLAVALLRAVLAVLLLGHAGQKLFGWFRGAGPAATGAMLESSGLAPGVLFAIMAGLSESAGAILLLVGLATPFATAVVIGAMIVAIGVNARQGLWAHLGGYEVALTYGVIALAIAFTGAGRYSLDHLIGIDGWRGPLAAGGALVIAALAASGPLLWRTVVLRRDHAERR